VAPLLVNGASGTSDMSGVAARVAVERNGSCRKTTERAGRPRHRSHNPRGEGERAGCERINLHGWLEILRREAGFV